MAFRADESARSGFESVKNYLIPRDIEAGERERSENRLYDIVDKYGPETPIKSVHKFSCSE